MMRRKASVLADSEWVDTSFGLIPHQHNTLEEYSREKFAYNFHFSDVFNLKKL
jgi:hypothetical protein